MSDNIPWLYDNARFIPHHDHWVPNLQIVALTVFFNEAHGVAANHGGMEYRDTLDLLAAEVRAWALKPGRMSKDRRLWRYEIERHKPKNGRLLRPASRLPKEFYRPWIMKNIPEAIWVPTVWVGTSGTVRLDDEAFDATNLYLAKLSGDELIPIRRGTAVYPVDPNREHRLWDVNKPRRIYGFWAVDKTNKS